MAIDISALAAKANVLMLIPVLSQMSAAQQAVSPTPEESCDIDPARIAESEVLEQHRLDSLNLLLFLFLLVITILTTWLFKQQRFRFMHETGLAMIYGAIVGVIVWYAAAGTTSELIDPIPDPHETCDEKMGNDTIYLIKTFPNNKSVTFEYVRSKVTHSNEFTAGSDFAAKVNFDPEVFFNILLPPIIFYAGYSLKRRHFFRNLGAIMTYALLGTTISCLVVGGIMYLFVVVLMGSKDFKLQDCFFFGALISATDPVTVLAVFHDLHVDVDMYILVFGESVLNDAVAIVLSKTVEEYEADQFTVAAFFKSVGQFVGIFVGSFVFGAVIGCLTSFLTKFTKIRDFPLLETALFFIMSYSSYLLAESFQLTGIVAVLFCGMTQAHYTYNNLSEESKRRTKETAELLQFLAENFIFSYMGVSVFNPNNQHWDPGFISAAFLAIIIGRACNIYPLTFLLNLGRKQKISYNFQHMLMFAGLRGAIAFALAIRNSSNTARQLILTATLMIVLSTVVLVGGATTQMLTWLKIRVGVEDEETSLAPGLQVPGVSSDLEARLRRRQEQAWLVRRWYDFDYKFMKPLLTKKGGSLLEVFPECCAPVALCLTIQDDTNTIDEDSDTDFILDEAYAEGELSRQNSTGNKSEEEAADGDLGLGDHHLRTRGLDNPPPAQTNGHSNVV